MPYLHRGSTVYAWTFQETKPFNNLGYRHHRVLPNSTALCILRMKRRSVAVAPGPPPGLQPSTSSSSATNCTNHYSRYLPFARSGPCWRSAAGAREAARRGAHTGPSRSMRRAPPGLPPSAPSSSAACTTSASAGKHAHKFPFYDSTCARGAKFSADY